MQIWHITPISDLEEHSQKSSHTLAESTQLNNIVCECKCNPRIEIEGGAIFIVHNAYDGREGVEWVNELLKNEENEEE